MIKIIKKLDKSFIFKSRGRKLLDKYYPKILKKDSKGNVLEIGVLFNPYKKYIMSTNYSSLDIEKKFKPTYNQDIHKTTLKNNEFDTIIATEVLEHLYNPRKAIKEIQRILSNEGKFIGTTRFIYPYHGMPHDYFRFTKSGIEELFKEFKNVKIIEMGNCLDSAIDCLTMSNKFFRMLNPITIILPLKINQKSKAPSGFIIIAKK